MYIDAISLSICVRFKGPPPRSTGRIALSEFNYSSMMLVVGLGVRLARDCDIKGVRNRGCRWDSSRVYGRLYEQKCYGTFAEDMPESYFCFRIAFVQHEGDFKLHAHEYS